MAIIVQISENPSTHRDTYTYKGEEITGEEYGKILSDYLNQIIEDMEDGQFLSLRYRVSDTYDQAEREVNGNNIQ